MARTLDREPAAEPLGVSTAAAVHSTAGPDAGGASGGRRQPRALCWTAHAALVVARRMG